VLGEYAAEAVYGLAHPEWRRSGALGAESTEVLPGDDLVVTPNWTATRAVTIGVPPSRVWPWLLQLGYGRGGWYSDMPWWKDPDGHTGARSSAATVLPRYQDLAVGDVLLDGAGCDEDTGAWTVVRLDPERALVLYSRRTLSGRELREGQRLPSSSFACSWSFVLRSTGDRATRLLVRTRLEYRPAWMVRLLAILRQGDTVMQRAMLLGIKRRAEAERSVEVSR
jgi:proline iminopeptidase